MHVSTSTADSTSRLLYFNPPPPRPISSLILSLSLPPSVSAPWSAVSLHCCPDSLCNVNQFSTGDSCRYQGRSCDLVHLSASSEDLFCPLQRSNITRSSPNCSLAGKCCVHTCKGGKGKGRGERET